MQKELFIKLKKKQHRSLLQSLDSSNDVFWKIIELLSDIKKKKFGTQVNQDYDYCL